MALVLVGFFLKGGEALPNIHFAFDLLSSYESQNTGEYLMKIKLRISKAQQSALPPCTNLISTRVTLNGLRQS